MASPTELRVPERPISCSISDTATVAGSPQLPTFTDGPVNSIEVPIVVPPTHGNRTLVLCFDGTGDQFDADNSNIVEFFTMLKKDNYDEQMVYYQAGIGTYTSPQVATPFAAKVSKTLDEMIAWNLDAHVMDGYEFLMQNYKAGDRICIFGFSRGAYTARSLAGMIHKVGLLPAYNRQQVPFAYKMYTRVDEIGWQQSNAFKQAFSVDVPIEFIGVWDTVNSVGIIPHRLPFTTSNKVVHTFRHAVSLDERRAKFKANLWNRPDAREETLGVEGQRPQVPETPTMGHKTPKMGMGFLDNRSHKLRDMENKYDRKVGQKTDVEEVWFSGCHCDIGGGSVPNDTPHSLARIPLRWMIRECFKANTGIMFMSNGLRRAGIDPVSLFPHVLTRPPPLPVTNNFIQRIPQSPPKEIADDLTELHMSEEEHELRDAMSPIYDQLDLKKFWWILEFFPIKQRYQQSNNEWITYLGMNLGGGRIIPGQKKNPVKVHRSVRMRMEAQTEDGKRYIPKALFETAKEYGKLEWVD